MDLMWSRRVNMWLPGWCSGHCSPHHASSCCHWSLWATSILLRLLLPDCTSVALSQSSWIALACIMQVHQFPLHPAETSATLPSAPFPISPLHYPVCTRHLCTFPQWTNDFFVPLSQLHEGPWPLRIYPLPCPSSHLAGLCQRC